MGVKGGTAHRLYDRKAEKACERGDPKNSEYMGAVRTHALLFSRQQDSKRPLS